jgi:peptide/nickel transport system substrate-binding protein
MRSAIRRPPPVTPCSPSRRTRDDLDAKIGPLWGEKDEAKRIAGWKAVDRYIAEQGYVLPLLQYYQPILYKADLKVTPNTSGALQPATLVSKA